MNTPLSSALTLAKHILARMDARGHTVNNLKLQKLLYYTQAWHLALHAYRNTFAMGKSFRGQASHGDGKPGRSACRRCKPPRRSYRLFIESGVRKAELARRIGIPKANVDRLFDLRHHSRLDRLEAAFRVLGKEIRIEVRFAA